jgi:hypothetical protein
MLEDGKIKVHQVQELLNFRGLEATYDKVDKSFEELTE